MRPAHELVEARWTAEFVTLALHDPGAFRLGFVGCDRADFVAWFLVVVSPDLAFEFLGRKRVAVRLDVGERVDAAGFQIQVARGVGGFALAAPNLGVINADIGPDPNIVWVSLVYTLTLAVGLLMVGRTF